MLVTNSEFKTSNKDSMVKKVSLMSKIGRALGNSFSKIVAAEINSEYNRLGRVELAMCVKQSMNKGLSNHPNA